MQFNHSLRPIAYSVRDAARVMSLGTTRLRQLIAAGEIKASKIGKRTLVDADSLHALLQRGCD